MSTKTVSLGLATAVVDLMLWNRSSATGRIDQSLVRESVLKAYVLEEAGRPFNTLVGARNNEGASKTENVLRRGSRLLPSCAEGSTSSPLLLLDITAKTEKPLHSAFFNFYMSLSSRKEDFFALV